MNLYRKCHECGFQNRTTEESPKFSDKWSCPDCSASQYAEYEVEVGPDEKVDFLEEDE